MENKKILISVPLSLLEEIDEFAKGEKLTRSEFIRQAVKKEIKLFKKRKRRKSLKEDISPWAI